MIAMVVLMAAALSAGADDGAPQKKALMPANQLGVESISQFVLYLKDIEVSNAI